ncbi:hypothetical protein [Streptococcus suis]|uniref:hypothetical protein n=1 Tax=Streptococcus suis TaxID=1307 RepID=UPI0003F6F022|nr:hypothetical protein [Streptococcus suis]HEM3213339.1 hypothetical protein [Streptococcus suis 12814]
MQKENMTGIINSFVLPRINRIANNNKEKDLLSIFYILVFLFIVIMSIFATIEATSPLLEVIKNNLTHLYKQILALNNFNETSYLSGSEIEINIKEIFSVTFSNFPQIIFVTIVSFCFRFFYRGKEKMSIEIIWLSSILLLYTILFKQYFQLAILVSFTFVLLTIIPLGDKRYFKIIQYLNYLEEISSNYKLQNNLDSKRSMKSDFKSTLIIFINVVSIVIISYSLNKLLSFSFQLSMVLSISIIVLIWIYKEETKKEKYLLKKISIYSVFFCFTLIGSNETDSNFLKLILVLISLFFTLEALLNLFKEVENLIISNSILYYHENEEIELKDLLKEITDIHYLKQIDVSEFELVRQIAIRLHLSLNKEFLELADLYAQKGYTNYLQYVEGNRYFINYASDIPLKNLKANLESIFSVKTNQRIWLPELFADYCYIMLKMNRLEEFERYFESIEVYLDKEIASSLSNQYKVIKKNL